MNEGIRISPKSREKLQAQIEIFADEGVKNFSEDQAQLLKYSGELAQITDLNNLPSDLSPEAVALVQKHKEAYVQFRRNEQKNETEFIESNIRTYREKFQTPIAVLKANMAHGDPKQLPEYLGSGSNGSAFRIEVDGKAYAAKFSSSIVQSNFEIKPLIRAKGIPHVAQLVAYSFEDGVVIMELLPGKDITKLGDERPEEFPEEHLVQLIETIHTLDASGLVIDPKSSNFMYEPRIGFSLLDFHLKKPGSRFGLPQEIMALKTSLGLGSIRTPNAFDSSAPDYEIQRQKQVIDFYKVSLPRIIKFLQLLQNKYPAILDEWKNQREELMKTRNISFSEFVDRKHIPDDPELKEYLVQLSEMGF